MEQNKQFTHLHLHTPYSLLDGFTKIDKVLDKAKELGMTACAITDHGVMFGAVEFYKKAKARGIKPIIGCEVYTANRTIADKESIDGKSGHLILLAKNKTGYQNLIKLVSISYTHGFYRKPRVDMELLKKYSDGLIALSACLAGDVQQLLLQGEFGRATKKAQEFEEIFGHDNFYLEMQDHDIEDQKRVNLFLREMSKQTGIPLVITNDVHYTDKQDYKSHDILLCIQTRKKLSDTDRMRFQTNEFYFKSRQEMEEIFPKDLEALDNTNKIADMCNFDFEFHTYHLPKYDVPYGLSAKEYLQKLCDEGINKRYEVVDEKIRQRLDYELSVIDNMGYNEYFLIVWDFINYAKKNKIPVGPGRGSAAGSIVAYSLEITDINPLQYDLLFERFLNPERISMPDIDVDFCYERREEVIDYVKQKYGVDHVSQIITFGTLKSKAAIKDCARVMDFSYELGDSLSKMIPSQNNIPVSIDEALSMNKDFKKRYETESQVKQLIDTAKTIEDLPRHASTHAAGVLIAGEPVDNFVPLFAQQDNVVAQFDMNTLEELGLLKMDFLGLRTLTVINDAILDIKQRRNIDIDLQKIDYEDQKVFENISNGNTLGVFQLEATGVKNYFKQLRPTHIEDIIAGTSIYRPGPMMFKDVYIENKKNPNSIKYHHEKLKPILKESYGVLIYQEQVMRIVRDLAGYSFAGADLVRRAMSKKKMETMQKERQKFIYGDEKEGIKGCIANGVDEKTANKIFDEMIDFAKYAFNKSHAAAYATVAFQTAYLKTYYMPEYMAALMTSYIGGTESEKKIVPCKLDCEENDIKILTPDINFSADRFVVQGDNAIRFPLSAIKGVGSEAAKLIAKERIENGLYKSFEDMARRLDSGILNKRVIEALIKSGSLDSISYTRADVMAHYEDILASVNSDKRNSIKGQINFFNTDKLADFVFEEKPKINEFRKEILLAQEKESLGFYISGSPLDKYKAVRKRFANTNTLNIDKIGKDEEEVDFRNIKTEKQKLIAMVTEVKVITDKNGNDMAFVKVSDEFSVLEMTVFSSLYKNVRDLLKKDEIIYIEGKVSVGYGNNDGNQLLADVIKSADELSPMLKIYVRVKDFSTSFEVRKVERFFHYSGDTNLIFYDEKTKMTYTKEGQNVYYNDELLEQLKEICGKENVKVV